ncbi:MAG: isochorismate synthase [Bacteroidota bacterium]|nr:isochorismate synthase [Bacteroidota bacterium]
MKEQFNSFLAAYEQFCLTKKTELKNNFKNSIISFVQPCNSFFPFELIDPALNSVSKGYYYESNSNSYKFLALGEVLNLNENGRQRFDTIDKKIKEIKKSFHSNAEECRLNEIPLFVGGMKFLTENEGKEWKDFDDSNWFIPSLVFLSYNNSNYIIHNCIVNASVERLKQNLEQKFLLIDTLKPVTNGLSNQIVNIAGNTPKEKKKWKQNIAAATEYILDSNVDKVVLSRRIDISLAADVSAKNVIYKLRDTYPECSIFLFKSSGSLFFGATPELLSRLSKNEIKIDALAGSAARGNSEEEDAKLAEELLNNPKDRKEHQIVIDHIVNALSKFANNIQLNNNFSVKKLSNIQHLHTTITAALTCENSNFKLLKDLFPTPAVSGCPKENSLALIKKLEEFQRGMYSGITGWFNFEEAEFVVAIRSALAIKNKVYAYAGCGIIDGSNGEEEYKESELKLMPILSIFKN